MAARSEFHGHVIVRKDDAWYYEDTDEIADLKNPRPCPHCGMDIDGEGYDPCLGKLPGVKAACCGHGGRGFHKPYIIFDNNMKIAGFDAVKFFSKGDPDKKSYKVDL